MSNVAAKVGQSLLKYFKPVRVAQPHRDPVETPFSTTPSNSKQHHKSTFSAEQEVLKREFKRNEYRKVGLSQAAADDSIIDLNVQTGTSPEKVPAHWIELVVYLLGACKKVTQKLKHKNGLFAYKTAMEKQVKRKIKIKGAIVDIDSDAPVIATKKEAA